MENATKALMIAGAVLIAIMIIGVGMMIFSSSNDMLTESLGGMDKYAIDQFNNAFIPYEGVQKGSQVKQLLSDIITLNATNAGVNDYKVVAVTYGQDVDKKEANEIRVIRTKIVSGKNYQVDLTYGETGGLITKITISDADSKTTTTPT